MKKIKNSWIRVFLCLTVISLQAKAGIEVCFSPDEACDDKLESLIKSAKRSVDVAVFDINLEKVVTALAKQSRRIKVRVVCDRRQSKGKYSQVSTLVEEGVPLRYGRQKGIMHDKFVIVDGQKLETGSFNFTNHATEANRENQLYLDVPEVVAQYQAEFETIWEHANPE